MERNKRAGGSHLVAVVALIGWVMLFLALLYIAGLRGENAASATPIGTFVTGSQAEREYVVFDQEGRYYQYRQRQPLQSGTYTYDGALITLHADGSRQAVFSGGLLYWDQELSGRYTVYEKTADVPTFVDVTFDDR